MDFRKQERRRQKEFRDSSPTVSSEGRCPTDDKGRRNGHLLALGYEEENLYPPLRGTAGAKAFLAARDIHWWRSSRSGDDTDSNGPTRNMASSQIACVNFLLPLAGTPEALVSILRSIDDDVREVATLQYTPRGTGLAVSSPVEFEWVGTKSCLEGWSGTRGANTTSADALMVGVTDKGIRRAYIFEWKYVEEYEGAEYLGDGKSGQTRRRRYEGLYVTSNSRFNGQVPLNDLFYEPFYQIMRLGLLGDKMVRESEFGVTAAKVVVVCPENNQAYRKTITSPALKKRFPDITAVEQVIGAALRVPGSFTMISPESLVADVRKSNTSSDLSEWLTYQAGSGKQTRYRLVNTGETIFEKNGEDGPKSDSSPGNRPVISCIDYCI